MTIKVTKEPNNLLQSRQQDIYLLLWLCTSVHFSLKKKKINRYYNSDVEIKYFMLVLKNLCVRSKFEE